jgi:hypothetical protein
MGFVEGETDSCSETCVPFDVDGTVEVSIKVEDAIYVKDEIPETISFSPINTEHEVRIGGACEMVAAYAFRPFIAPTKSCEIALNYFLLCVILWVPNAF